MGRFYQITIHCLIEPSVDVPARPNATNNQHKLLLLLLINWRLDFTSGKTINITAKNSDLPLIRSKHWFSLCQNERD